MSILLTALHAWFLGSPGWSTAATPPGGGAGEGGGSPPARFDSATRTLDQTTWTFCQG